MASHGNQLHPARKEVKGPAGGRIASSLSCEDSFLDQSLPAIAGCAAGSVTVSSDMGRWIFLWLAPEKNAMTMLDGKLVSRIRFLGIVKPERVLCFGCLCHSQIQNGGSKRSTRTIAKQWRVVQEVGLIFPARSSPVKISKPPMELGKRAGSR